MIKKVFITVLVGILMLPCSVSAAYYNSEDVYKDVFPSVRDQKDHSDCWSFAATGAVSYSMAVNDGADFSEEESLFSEWHMASAMNVAHNKLFEKYTRSHEEGGNRESAVAYLARSFASGPVLSKGYGEEKYEMYLSGILGYEMLGLEKKQATLTQARFLTGRSEGSSLALYDESTKKVTYKKNEEVINKIKNAVRKYGAVAVSYYAYERDQKTYYNKEEAAYCVPWKDYINKKTPDGNSVKFSPEGYKFEKASNHVVMIVGWDDNYSYENFKDIPVSFDGENYTIENGAWIVKNSWGTQFGKDGYEYISYMEPTICQAATVYDMEYTEDYEAVTHTQKGLMGSVRFPSVGYGVCAANRFDKKGLINAVGIYVLDKNPTVEILIDTEPEKDLKRFSKGEFEKRRATLIDMETGEEAQSIKFENPGYYMLRLKENLQSDGKFDVYVKYTVDEKCDVILPAGNNIGTDEIFTPSVTYWAHITGNGYVHKWKGIDVNWCINAFTTDADFEKVKVEKNKDEVTFKLYRYSDKAKGRIVALFYKDGKVIGRESLLPEFDKYGYWEKSIKTDADSVKAFVLRKIW